jgi:uncharacterized protein YbaP (TraB family)
VLAALALLAPPARGAPLFLWEAAGPRATVTMAGSIHVGRADFFPLPAPFGEAFAAADVLAVELDATSPHNQAAVMRLLAGRGTLPDTLTLRDRLAPGNWERLRKAAGDLGLPDAAIERLQPGLVAMMLVMQAYQKQGLDPELGIDKHFLDAAHAAARPVRELETVEAQMSLFLDLDDELDDVLVADMLDQLDELQGMTEAMIDAWKTGDAPALDELLQEQAGSDPRLAAWYRRLLDERNVAMADSVDAWLRGDRDVFLVVGAGHFSGEHGLVSLLERRGWTVTQRRQ